MQNNKQNKKVMDIRSVNNITAKKTSRSNTLMRKYVQKPKTRTKGKITPKIESEDLDFLNKKNIQSRINLDIISKAKKNIPKSSMVSRFSSKTNIKTIKNSAPISKGIEISKVVKPILDDNVLDPARKIIESSLKKVNSEDYKYLPKKDTKLRKLFITFIIVVLAILLLNFYEFIYPKLKIYFASNVAGFNAATAKFIPPGYSLEKVIAQKGSIDSVYDFNTSKLKFSINESPSTWDDATLIDAYLVPNGDTNYNLITANGINIYAYGDGNATWVTGGIWYVLNGNSNISNNDLVKIATSM